MKRIKFTLLATAMLLAAPAFLTSCDKDTPKPAAEEFVDLGLSVKWAKKNLGASKPSDYGGYYAWGENTPKDEYTWENYKWGIKRIRVIMIKYTATDGKNTLEPADDAANTNLGQPWRMPMAQEIKELIEKCTWTWTAQEGVNGYEVKGPNGNTIFLPAAGNRSGSEIRNAGSGGYYWSASLPPSGGTGYASAFLFSSAGHAPSDGTRCYGFSVRPVRP